MSLSIFGGIFRKKNKRRIVCAAIHFSDGKIYKCRAKNIEDGFVVGGVKHSYGDMIEPISSLLKGIQFKATEGFLTSDNEFVDREQAAKIAHDAGQIKHRVQLLYSDHLY